MDLTIIIVNYNSYRLLISCLESVRNSLKNSGLKYEIFIIDNASNPKEQVNIKRLTGVKIIFNHKNVGFGRACNQGIYRASGRFILLINPDIIVLDEAIWKLFNFLNEKEKSFAGGRLLNKDYTNQPSCGLFFTLPVVFTMLFLEGEKLGITKFSPNNTKKVDWISGACLMGRKEDFLKVGCFDEKIFLYTEEVDFLLRAKKKGFSCFFYREAEFIHFGSATSGREKTVINLFKGLLYYYKKHHSSYEYLFLKLFLIVKTLISLSLGFIISNKELSRKYQEVLPIIKNHNSYL